SFPPRRSSELSSAEDLHFEIGARAAGAQDAIDQLLHRRAAIASRAARDVLPSIGAVAARTRQHEVIHAADAKARVADAGGYARAQDRVQHFLPARHVVVAGQQLDDEIAVSIAIAANALEAGQGFRKASRLNSSHVKIS